MTGSVPRGMVRPQMAYVGPPIAAAHQAMPIAHEIVPVISATRTQTTSSQDCRSRAGAVSRRRIPSLGSAVRYSGWARVSPVNRPRRWRSR